MPAVAEKTLVNTFNPDSPKVQQQIKRFTGPFLRFGLLYKLPMAWFMGLKVKSLTPYKAEATIPYGWRSQNPFRSIYFIAQAGAAEFPSGMLALLAITDRGCDISLLVSKVESEFTKKATALTTFTCEDGLLIQETVQKAIDTGEAQACTVTSIGKMPNGEIVSTHKLTWSFKVR